MGRETGTFFVYTVLFAFNLQTSHSIVADQCEGFSINGGVEKAPREVLRETNKTLSNTSSVRKTKMHTKKLFSSGLLKNIVNFSLFLKLTSFLATTLHVIDLKCCC